MPGQMIDYKVATRMLRKGLTVLEVADYFGVTSTAIYMGIQRGNIKHTIPSAKRMDTKKANTLLRSGMTARAVSKHLGVERGTVYNAMRAGRVKRPSHIMSGDGVRRMDLKQIAEMLALGRSVPSVAKEVGFSRQAIYQAIEEGRLPKPVNYDRRVA